ncbi:MAG: cytochrome c biogenesis protein CcdA [Candidatus Omnitrophota bacterium]
MYRLRWRNTMDMALNLENITVFTYLAVFAGGIGISFTPCIYPLIPVIVSIIGASHESSKIRNFVLSLSYVLGMAVTFSVLGVAAALTGKLFGQIQTSPIAHLVVGNVMILFGLALLDVIPLPLFWLNRAGAGKIIKGGNIFTIFFMGVISGFVAAPCTAAVLGALLAYVAATQNVFAGFSLLLVFALGFGIALVLIGTFAGIVTALPRSEKAMAVIQKIFAFAIILLGEYFVFKAGFLSV